MAIKCVQVYRLSLPLIIPYKLAFGSVTAFDTVIVKVTDDDEQTGFGEATILTGYTDETIDSCWHDVCGLADAVSGLPADAAIEVALKRHDQAPFSVTALVTAIEMMERCPALDVSEDAQVPLLAILNKTDKEGIASDLQSFADRGYRTVKVKVGWDVEDDLARVAYIQSCLPDGISIRIDGNQGFSAKDGVTFASTLSAQNVELLEQPCHMNDWVAAADVSSVSTVPFMLDESIYGDREIERAAELGTVQYIKLKLMKAGSLNRLERQLSFIRECNMTPVLGNGVATDVGCWMEVCVARRMIDNAGEMNGFLKPRQRLFGSPLSVDDGKVHLPAGRPEVIDLERIAASVYTVAD